VLATKRGRQALAIAAVAIAIAPAEVRAQQESAADRAGERAAGGAPPRPSDEPVPSCLDQSIVDELGQSLRPRGVQKREFLKRGKVQILPRGGMLAGDLLSTSYLAGGAISFFLTEDLGIEASFDVTHVALDLDRPLAEFTGDDRFEPGLGFLALGGLLWSPVHAKMKMGESIVHADFLLAAGGGRLLHDSAQGYAFDGGLLLDLFVSRLVTLRFELRDLVLVQEATGETRLTNNLMATAGVGLWLPTGW